jgi:hypothetical protein
MSRNDINENTSPLLVAGLACFLSLPVVYLTTRPVVWLVSAPWVAWLQLGIFAIAPVTVTCMVLYRCAWHDDRPRTRRILSTILSACIIFGFVLLLISAIAIVGCVVVGTSRVMGGN